MTLIKHDLILSIADKGGYSKNRSSNLLESCLEIIKSTLESGEDVLVSGFGNFCVKNKSVRTGRTPQNENALYLEARRVVAFRSSPLLIGKINSKKKIE